MRLWKMRQLNEVLVSAYKASGFVMLAVILLGLLSYIGAHIFYFVNRTWIAPTIIAPTDQRVLRINTEVAAQSTLRDGLLAQRADVEAKLADARRVVTSEEEFLEQLEASFESDLTARRTELHRLESLLSTFEKTRRAVSSSVDAYRDMSEQELRALAEARLIPRQELLARNYQLSKAAQDKLSMAAKALELENQKQDLERRVSSLRGATTLFGKGDGARGKLSAEDIRIAQEYRRSALELERARGLVESLEHNMQSVQRSIDRHERLITSLSSSPFLLAVEGRLTVAFVPYANLPRVGEGSRIYRCAFGPLWCRRIGQVIEVLDGELDLEHPLFKRRERGLLVEIRLDDPKSAEEPVLFVGRAPFFI